MRGLAVSANGSMRDREAAGFIAANVGSGKIVGQYTKGRVLGEWCQRAEVSSIEREDRVGLVLGGQSDLDGVGEIQTQIWIQPADRTRLIENVGCNRRDFEVPGARLSGEILDHLDGDLPPERAPGDVVEFSEYQRRDDYKSGRFENAKRAIALR